MENRVIVALESVRKDLTFAIEDAETKSREETVESIRHTVRLIDEMLALETEFEKMLERLGADVQDRKLRALLGVSIPDAQEDVRRLSRKERRKQARKEKKAPRE